MRTSENTNFQLKGTPIIEIFHKVEEELTNLYEKSMIISSKVNGNIKDAKHHTENNLTNPKKS